MNSELSLHNRGIPDHTTYAGPRPTYFNLPSDPLKQERIRATPRIQYSTNPAHCHVGTRYSRHLSNPSARVAILVIELPSKGLPEYVVSTTNSHLMQFNNGTCLNRHRRKEPAHKTSMSCGSHTPSPPGLDLLLHIPISHDNISNQSSI